jgi:hypothetical protein
MTEQYLSIFINEKQNNRTGTKEKIVLLDNGDADVIAIIAY